MLNSIKFLVNNEKRPNFAAVFQSVVTIEKGNEVGIKGKIV